MDFLECTPWECEPLPHALMSLARMPFDRSPPLCRPAEEAWESELAWIEREALPELEGKVAALRQESEGVLTEAKGLRKGKGMAEPQSADRRRLAGERRGGHACRQEALSWCKLVMEGGSCV